MRPAGLKGVKGQVPEDVVRAVRKLRDERRRLQTLQLGLTKPEIAKRFGITFRQLESIWREKSYLWVRD